MKPEHSSKYLQIGLKIAYYRKFCGLTQEQLAEKVGVTATFIGHIEAPNVQKGFSLDTVFDIAQVLGIPVYKFFLFEDDL